MTASRATAAGALPIAHPERIRTARDLRGLTQRETVERMPTPVTPAALSQIEAGKVRPSDRTVQDLALALEVPPGFFAARRATSAVPFFRDLRATPVRERRRAAAYALLLHDVVSVIEEHVRLPAVRVPSYPLEASAPRSEIESIAEAVRGEWDLGHDPIPHVVREIERHGVPVARLTLNQRAVDAFAVWFAHRPLVLLSADKSSYVRSRFDAAHELGHLVMHRRLEPGDKVLERQAHEFASCLLLPRDVAQESLPRRLDPQGWMALASIKQAWGISMAAILMRAKMLGLISPEAHRNAMKYMSMRGWRVLEPGDRELGLPESPLLLERALSRVAMETGLSAAELAVSAELPVEDILELVAAVVDGRPSVEV